VISTAQHNREENDDVKSEDGVEIAEKAMSRYCPNRVCSVQPSTSYAGIRERVAKTMKNELNPNPAAKPPCNKLKSLLEGI